VSDLDELNKNLSPQSAASQKRHPSLSVEIFVGYPKQKETNALLEVQAIRDSGMFTAHAVNSICSPELSFFPSGIVQSLDSEHLCATSSDLHSILIKRVPHVLHYMGHGDKYRSETKRGCQQQRSALTPLYADALGHVERTIWLTSPVSGNVEPVPIDGLVQSLSAAVCLPATYFEFAFHALYYRFPTAYNVWFSIAAKATT